MGQNGVGKTTLMNAINNGKLEGWPIDLRTEYVDSGSNVDPVHEAKIVFTHLQNATSKSEEECRAMLEQLKFTSDMMKGSIGELSGGWQMKLRLAQAVLIDADILLLDEPTNHLVRFVELKLLVFCVSMFVHIAHLGHYFVRRFSTFIIPTGHQDCAVAKRLFDWIDTNYCINC